jgi:predicted NodU family carbamoyl transferase
MALEIKKNYKRVALSSFVGLLYSAFTYYTGFRVNSGEYKLMGLAPYGIQDSQQKKNLKTKYYPNW